MARRTTVWSTPDGWRVEGVQMADNPNPEFRVTRHGRPVGYRPRTTGRVFRLSALQALMGDSFRLLHPGEQK